MGGNKGQCSSYNVFMSFVSEGGDASGILSAACYERWVSTRKSTLKQPEESFRRVLTAHVCGLIGRKPFPADIEASLLRCLRKKQIWPCFRDTEVTIGIKGFRKTGFHESRRGIFGSSAVSSTLSPKQKQAVSTSSHSSTGNFPLTNAFITPNSRLAQSQAQNHPQSFRRESHSTYSTLSSSATRRESLQSDSTRASVFEHTTSFQPSLNEYNPSSRRPSQIVPVSGAPDVAFIPAALDESFSNSYSAPQDLLADGQGQGVTLGAKRSLDSLDPLHIFNHNASSGSFMMTASNNSPRLTSLQTNLHSFVPLTKRFKSDSEQLPLNSNLYPWKRVNSNFFLTGFQDIHVPGASSASYSNQNWPLA